MVSCLVFAGNNFCRLSWKKRNYCSLLDFRHIAAVKNLQHFFFQPLFYFAALAGGKIFFRDAEKIIIQIELFEDHFGMENIFLIDIHIDSLVFFPCAAGNIILDRIDFVIYKIFFAADISCKTSYTVINGNYIRFKAMDEVV